ncbi:MAG: hypothetical protein ACXAE3_00785 [Candidatus Kariarchaeaceae archaeon]
MPILSQTQNQKRYAVLVDTSSQTIISLSFERIDELLSMVLHHPHLRLYRTQYSKPGETELAQLEELLKQEV